MKAIKYCLILFLFLNCGRAWAQTSTSATTPAEHEADISANSFYFDGVTNQMVYLGHVFVDYHQVTNVSNTTPATNATHATQAKLFCEKLTVFLPEDRSNPTNIVAETNVVVDITDEHGQTNHITADKAVYTYQLFNPVTNIVKAVPVVVYANTNETIIFTGGTKMPRLSTLTGYMDADPLIFYVAQQRFDTPNHVEMHWRQLPGSGGSTNGFKF